MMIERNYYTKKENGKTIKVFPFAWTGGSLNSNGTKLLKEAGISFCYRLQKLNAYNGTEWVPVEYKQHKGLLWTMEF